MLLGGTFAATTVEILAGDARFTTLVNFVTQAGLVDTINNGNFTIFAPTNDAFAKLPNSTVQALSDINLLKDVLLYHVTSGFVMKSDAMNDLLLTMANSGKARINIYPHNHVVTIQNCNISEFDKVASNGVIHVIDSVMMQPKQNLVQFVAANPELSTLLSLVQNAGLASALEAEHLTLFAPTNAAFANVSADKLDALSKDMAMLSAVLTYHVVNSTEFSISLYKREHLQTFNTGRRLTVHFRRHPPTVLINHATVVSADNQVTNGVVHIIDNVLLAPTNGPVVGR